MIMVKMTPLQKKGVLSIITVENAGSVFMLSMLVYVGRALGLSPNKFSQWAHLNVFMLVILVYVEESQKFLGSLLHVN